MVLLSQMATTKKDRNTMVGAVIESQFSVSHSIIDIFNFKQFLHKFVDFLASLQIIACYRLGVHASNIYRDSVIVFNDFKCIFISQVISYVYWEKRFFPYLAIVFLYNQLHCHSLVPVNIWSYFIDLFTVGCFY